MKRSLKWTVALLASGVLHAGAAAFMLREAPEEVQIEGSAAMEIAVLGSFEDAFQAGDPVEPLDTITPVEDPSEATEPVMTETAAETPQVAQPVEAQVAAPAHTAPAATVAPVPTAETAATEAVEGLASEQVATAQPDVSEPIESDPTLPAQVNVPAPPVASEEAAQPTETSPAVAVPAKETPETTSTPTADVVEANPPQPVETTPHEPSAVTPQQQPVEVSESASPVASETEPAQAPKTETGDAPEVADEVQTALAVVPPVAEAVEPVEPEEVIEAVEEFPIPEDVPLPTARPEPPAIRQAVVRPDRARTEPRRQQQTERKPAPRASGDGGRQKSSTTRGQANGSDRGSAVASGTGNRSSQAGNAAVSNYPGQVASKLRRAVRAVSRSARRGAQRDVHVSFVVTASGGLGSARITQSSGSAALDQAALAAVRKAAPFPPIPPAAGRSSWNFAIPLGLAR